MKTGICWYRSNITCLVPIIACLFFASCKKDSFITSSDARLSTSTDSLKYDTVFTSIGSVTQSFKISNPNNQKLLLSKVKLMGGSASAFKINVNGMPAPEISDIEIDAEDSIYVFVTVHINPNTVNLPFIVRDSIQIMYNGNSRFVQLEAYGQNANFLRNRIIHGNITWTNNLPYIILGSLQVDTNASLTIEAGCKIYSHADAPIIVDGSLITSGTKGAPVVFAGDRLDNEYRDLPASWPGIYFRENSSNNIMSYTVVKNAYQAIVAENPPPNANPKIVLHQCIVDNAYDAGILCVNSSVQADNSLVSNCGKNISIILGGNYSFTNCTVAGYPSYVEHKSPVLTISNSAMQNGSTLTSNLSATFTNCIFWGDNNSVENEVVVEKEGATAFIVNFNSCLYKAVTDPANSGFTNSIANQDPMFDSIDVSKRSYDFHTNNSQAAGIDKGIVTGFTKDLDNNNRNIGLPDLGAYEKQ